MKWIGVVAAILATGMGVYLHHSQDSNTTVFEIAPDGKCLFKGTMATNVGTSTCVVVTETPARVQPGDRVLWTEVAHRRLPLQYRTVHIDRNGASIEYSSGKARYYGIIWGLTLLPVVLWILAYVILSPFESKRRAMLP